MPNNCVKFWSAETKSLSTEIFHDQFPLKLRHFRLITNFSSVEIGQKPPKTLYYVNGLHTKGQCKTSFYFPFPSLIWLKFPHPKVSYNAWGLLTEKPHSFHVAF